MKKIERRDLVAAGGLAAFAAGFSQTLGRMADAVVGEKPERHNVYGRALEPEFTVDRKTGAIQLNPKQQVSYTGCLGCTTQCGVRVRVDKASGRILRVSGNPYSPLSTDPYLPMGTPVKDSLVGLSLYQDKGLGGRATACGRGNAALDQMTSPYRVLTPLKRVGPRNSGRWQAISFEQLIQEVTEGGDLFGEGHVEGLASIRDVQTPIDPNAPELGPRVNQVGVMMGLTYARDSLAQRFWRKAYGTINYVGHGSYCGGAYRSGSAALFGDFKGMPHAKTDFSNAEFAMFVGTAPGNAGNPFKRSGALVAKGRTEGRLDYVVIDPVLTNADNRAVPSRNHWVPIRPSTDGALAMAMMRWMFENDRVNRAYLSYPNLKAANAAGEPSFTNASWLVITQEGHPRQGSFLRGSDLGMPVAAEDRYKDKDPYYVLDASGQLAEAATLGGPARLEATEPVVLDGQPVEVKTSLQLLRASAEELTLTQASEITGIPQDVIVGLAREFTSHGRKASVISHGGMMGGNGFYNAYALMTLNALIGSLNCKGGYAISAGGFKDASNGPRYNLDTFDGQVKSRGVRIDRVNLPYEKSSEFKRRQQAGQAVYPATDQWYPNAPGLATEWLSSSFKGYPYPLKALIVWATNPVYGIPGLRTLEKELTDPKKLPLIISVDPFINESNAFADYIVPDHVMYECWGWVGHWGVPTKCLTAWWPLVEAKTAKAADGQSICMETFMLALAKKMNLPGFGPEGLRDMDGNPVPLERPEDWYLRGGANVAFAGGKPLDDATDEDLRFSGVERIAPMLQSRLKADEWRKVASIYARGGRYQPIDESQDKDHPEWQTWRFNKPLWIWNEQLATSRNSLSGQRRKGCAGWQPPAFSNGQPMREVYTVQEWPLTVVSYKSALHNPYSIGTTISRVRNENPVIVHPEDARRAGLRSGDMASLQTPGGAIRCQVIVHEGVVQGTVAIEHGYGHREFGARTQYVDGKPMASNPALGLGVSLNDLGM
ncbi:MAG: molybdopterin dinucleotide binding domain-containing protein, partial [Comamonadaceae bacterium]|nr:molybdopterin dinucleotide binding domain-containing protein [Comamonadaceae bacterium]